MESFAPVLHGPVLALRTFPDDTSTIGPKTDESGLQLWSVNRIFCALLHRFTSLLEGKRVLELGCGIGALGLFAASLGGAQQVTLTDASVTALELAKQNVGQLPAAATRCVCEQLVHMYTWAPTCA